MFWGSPGRWFRACSAIFEDYLTGVYPGRLSVKRRTAYLTRAKFAVYYYESRWLKHYEMRVSRDLTSD